MSGPGLGHGSRGNWAWSVAAWVQRELGLFWVLCLAWVLCPRGTGPVLGPGSKGNLAWPGAALVQGELGSWTSGLHGCHGCIVLTVSVNRGDGRFGYPGEFYHILDVTCSGNESSIEECSLDFNEEQRRCSTAVACVPADSASRFLPGKNQNMVDPLTEKIVTTVCTGEEFKCLDGFCGRLPCDGVTDCLDGSDEFNPQCEEISELPDQFA